MSPRNGFAPLMPIFRMAAVACAAGLIAFVLGCAGASRGFPKDPRDACEFVVMLDKQVYQIGEMAVAKVAVSNRSLKPIVLSPPRCFHVASNSNLHFRVLEVNDTKILRRPPVEITAPAEARAVRLQPFETLVEKYAFVSLTERAGRFRILVEYTGNPQPDIFPRPEAPEAALPMTRVVEYEVREPRLFERDTQGLLVKNEAIRVARRKYDRPVRAAHALLVKTETQLFDWWVTLERDPADLRAGEEPYVAFYVSPYGGFVREQTEPLTVDIEKVLTEPKK